MDFCFVFQTHKNLTPSTLTRPTRFADFVSALVRFPMAPFQTIQKPAPFGTSFCVVGWPPGIEPGLSVPQTEVITVIPWPPWYQWCDISAAHLTRLLYHIGVLLTSIIVGLSLTPNHPFHHLRKRNYTDEHQNIIQNRPINRNRN